MPREPWNAEPNTVLAGPASGDEEGGSAFRALVDDDLPGVVSSAAVSQAMSAATSGGLATSIASSKGSSAGLASSQAQSVGSSAGASASVARSSITSGTV